MPVTRIYARASTDKQALSPERQVARCMEYHKALGTCPPLLGLPHGDPSKHAYRDAATSGSTEFATRPAGRALILACEFKDHLIVDAYDRIGRDIPDTLNTVRLLNERGVVIHILNLLILSQLDPRDPMAETMLMQFAAFAQFERKMISIRTKRGIHSKRMEGYSTGFGRPVGYKTVPNPEYDPTKRNYAHGARNVPRLLLIPDPEDQAYFDAALARYTAGEKIAVIHRRQRSYAGAAGWSYGRLKERLADYMKRSREEEMRQERQRVFGGMR